MIELTKIDTHGGKQADGYLSLPIDSRIKSRLKVTLDDGRDAGLFLPRGHILRGGEQLTSQCGLVVEVKRKQRLDASCPTCRPDSAACRLLIGLARQTAGSATQ